ncbi:MAG: hypothetical protein K2X82_00305, partial [Gemmataceae bacterium]|nr:hypothetical protein [Gemmataceae bacterium]
PPKPAGRGPVFWVLIGLLAVGLVTVAACGGAIALLGPKWRAHTSAAGGFRVDLPAEPQPDVADMLLAKAAPGARAEGAMLVGRLEVYGVIYTDLDPAARLTPPKVLLDQAVRAIEDDNPGTRVVRNDPATVSGFPAREIAYTDPDDATFLCRLVVAGSRLYILSAGGPRAGPAGNPRIRRFLDSFQVTDPKLLAEKNRPAAGDPLAALRERLEAARKKVVGRPPPDADDEPDDDPPAPVPVAPPPRPAPPRDD